MVTETRPQSPSSAQPPADFRTWDFSYSAKQSQADGRNRFRFLDPETGAAYFCDGIAKGSWAAIIDSRDKDSHMEVMCELQGIGEDGIAVTAVPEGIELPIPFDEATEWIPASKYRLCAVTPVNQERQHHPEGWWRFRDEVLSRENPNDPKALRYVAGYRGIVPWFWDDHGPHVHVEGLPAFRDGDNVAWFYLPDMLPEGMGPTD